MKVTDVTNGCEGTDFPVYGEQAFKCLHPPTKTSPSGGHSVSMPTIFSKVFPEVFAFVLGASLVDMLIYLISRFASVAPNPMTGLMNIDGPFSVFAVSINPALSMFSPVDPDSQPSTPMTFLLDPFLRDSC